MIEGTNRITFGLQSLDAILGGLLPGDNVVWVTDDEAAITLIEDSFLCGALQEGHPASYVTTWRPPEELRKRFGPRVTILDARPGQPLGEPTALAHAMLERAGLAPLESVVVDSLQALAARWGPKAVLTFFSRTCPQLFNLGALAYWRASPDLLAQTFLERIHRVTQCVIEIIGDRIRVLKAEGRPAHLQGQLLRFQLDKGTITIRPEWALGRLGEGLIRLRKARNLTQASLAGLAGVTPSAISQAETGRRGLSLDTLMAISDNLHVSLDDLLASGQPLGYTVVRHDRLGADDPVTVLLDDLSTGLRAVLVRLASGQSGEPPYRHKGTELVLVGSGLVQLEVGGESPVVRAGDAVLATSAPIEGWRNLLRIPARLFWIPRDP